MRGPSTSRESGGYRWLAAPAAVLLLVGFVVPMALIFAQSFGVAQPFGAAQPVSFERLSFDNYARAWEPTYLWLVARTIVMAAVGTLGCLLLGLPVAYTLATRVSARRKPLLLLLLVLPFWTSFLLRTFAWRILLSANGPLSGGLQAVGLLDGPLALLDTVFAVQLGIVYNYLPLMILPLFVAFDRIDPRLRDASRDLGAGPWTTFRRVSWPLARPGVVAGCVLVFIPLAGEYVTPSILGGVRGMMAGGMVASQFLEARDWALGGAQATLLVIAILSCATVPALFARLSASTRGAHTAGPTAPSHP